MPLASSVFMALSNKFQSIRLPHNVARMLAASGACEWGIKLGGTTKAAISTVTGITRTRGGGGLGALNCSHGRRQEERGKRQVAQPTQVARSKVETESGSRQYRELALFCWWWAGLSQGPI